MRRNNPAGTGMRGKRFASRRCRDTNSDPRRIAETVWIFSRAEWVALATTERTDKMPGGMARLNHVSKYKADWLNVQNSFQRSVVSDQLSVVSIARRYQATSIANRKKLTTDP